MKKLWITFCLLLAGVALAIAQQVSMPPPAGTIAILCAYNSATQTIATGNVGFVQCASNGALIAQTAGAQTIATSQVSIASTATQIVAARVGRAGVLVCNLGAVDIYLGTSTVTTPTGLLLLGTKGTCATLPVQSALYGIVTSGTQSVSYMETY